ncbi:hypothetical protein, conserved [Eimeria maxima]|uniref:Uncharacterized protein n=1 Tax=Eimeria maxima TaxID=5804 RepID=U6LWM9_EIMMA|nr:hypothetical protein, conserved [Eimeria maxima]CDJ56131.1 hypothetical protein, conserved [Eimeria maxima]
MRGGGIRIKPPGVRFFRIWPHIEFKRMNYPTWPPPNSSPLHPIEPWGRQVFVFTPYAVDSSAPLSGPYPRQPPLRGAAPPSHHLSPHLASLAAAAAAAADRAAAAVGAAGESSWLCDSAYEAAKEATAAAAAAATAAAAEYNRRNIEEIYNIRRLFLPYKSVGMQRMKKGEHDSYGMKKGVQREKKT